ncbi:hypothetical protein ACIBLA_22050 [Streptomyces sp. NPDC050433]|uniref:effector-associated constant component EACC1 n=1 Tax=unclassified Streptomyces TaxID=2593676 RepID=UPI00341FD104
MRAVITVQGEDGPHIHELRQWLSEDPRLRGRIRAGGGGDLPAGAMGVAADALIALLAPGGVAAVFAGAVVAWAQTRRGSQTITITRPDGTEITVSSDRVRGLDAQETATLARQLAAEVVPAPDDPGSDATPARGDGPPAP